MTTIETFLRELDEEVQITKKMLAIVPDEKYSWRPHERSMSISELTTHIAELPGWVKICLTTKELDFGSNPYDKALLTSTDEVMEANDISYSEGRAALAKATQADLSEEWTMRNGEHIISVRTKAEVIRMSLSQMVHHRAQLGVFLRLLNVPIAGSYGPSADELAMHRDYQAA